jgi:hypothetical protein
MRIMAMTACQPTPRFLEALTFHQPDGLKPRELPVVGPDQRGRHIAGQPMTTSANFDLVENAGRILGVEVGKEHPASPLGSTNMLRSGSVTSLALDVRNHMLQSMLPDYVRSRVTANAQIGGSWILNPAERLHWFMHLIILLAGSQIEIRSE